MRCMAEVSYKMLCELGKTKAVMARALGILSRSAHFRITLKNPMPTTPIAPS